MTKDEQSYHPAPTQDDEAHSNDEEPTTPPRYTRRRLKIHYIGLTVAYLLLLFLYLALGRKTISSDCSPRPQRVLDKAWLPVFPSLHEAAAIEYESRIWPVDIHHSPFAGKPRPELEDAWHGLFEKNNIRVRREDLEFYNVTSLPIVGSDDGQGHWVGQMGVFHELHCLKRVRHWIYREIYLTEASEAMLVEEEAHVDHCIELLREAILCRGDPTLSEFNWVKSQDRGEDHLTVEAPGYHTCVNWDKLRAWNDERAVDAFQPGVLVGPDGSSVGTNP